MVSGLEEKDQAKAFAFAHGFNSSGWYGPKPPVQGIPYTVNLQLVRRYHEEKRSDRIHDLSVVFDPGFASFCDGVFRDIPMVPNAISVHVGDVMTRLTGGIVPATPHRVLSSDRPRRSIGFFLEPALTAPVTAAKDTRDPVPPEDTYGWQLIDTFAKRPHWAEVMAQQTA